MLYEDRCGVPEVVAHMCLPPKANVENVEPPSILLHHWCVRCRCRHGGQVRTIVYFVIQKELRLFKLSVQLCKKLQQGRQVLGWCAAYYCSCLPSDNARLKSLCEHLNILPWMDGSHTDVGSPRSTCSGLSVRMHQILQSWNCGNQKSYHWRRLSKSFSMNYEPFTWHLL